MLEGKAGGRGRWRESEEGIKETGRRRERELSDSMEMRRGEGNGKVGGHGKEGDKEGRGISWQGELKAWGVLEE